jgi:cytochrome b561
MNPSEQVQSYGPWARRLHWISAALALTMLIAGQRFELDLPAEKRLFSLAAHSPLGICLMVVMAIRVAHRVLNPPPALPITMPAWQRVLAAAVHGGLYGLLFAVPVLGLIAASASPVPVQPAYLFDLTALLGTPDDGRFMVLRRYHELGTWVLAGLVAVHVAAALTHRYVWKDGVLGRMWVARR